MTYTFPDTPAAADVAPKTAYLIASGDLRESANVAGWPTQAAMEADVTRAFAELGITVIRANGIDPETGHGFISSQRMGLEVFKTIPTDAPLIVHGMAFSSRSRLKNMNTAISSGATTASSRASERRNL